LDVITVVDEHSAFIEEDNPDTEILRFTVSLPKFTIWEKEKASHRAVYRKGCVVTIFQHNEIIDQFWTERLEMSAVRVNQNPSKISEKL
jgi:hypothetical protein